MPDLLDSRGRLKLLPTSAYDAIGPEGLRLWCHHHARYGLPTLELVDWVREEIGDREAIEIGAGHGDLGYRLGIPATDSWNQALPEVAHYYRVMGQPVIQYPEWVVRLDALAAVEHYQPEVVVASWVTQWVDPDKDPPRGGGSVYGVKEEEILDRGITYILIGNITVHGDKRIMKIKHRELELPFLRSRSSRPELNRVWVWNG